MLGLFSMSRVRIFKGTPCTVRAWVFMPVRGETISHLVRSPLVALVVEPDDHLSGQTAHVLLLVVTEGDGVQRGQGEFPVLRLPPLTFQGVEGLCDGSKVLAGVSHSELLCPEVVTQGFVDVVCHSSPPTISAQTGITEVQLLICKASR